MFMSARPFHVLLVAVNKTSGPLQEQFYQLWESAPDSSAYNSGFTALLEGPLNVAALQAAVHAVFERQQVRHHFTRAALQHCLPARRQAPSALQ